MFYLLRSMSSLRLVLCICSSAAVLWSPTWTGANQSRRSILSVNHKFDFLRLLTFYYSFFPAVQSLTSSASPSTTSARHYEQIPSHPAFTATPLPPFPPSFDF